MKRIISQDAATGKTTYLQQDADGDKIVREQKFDQLVELNRFMNNGWDKNSLHGTQKHIVHIAEIPNVLYHHLLEKLGHPRDNQKAWKAWLNDSENRDFRTGGGYI
jgi:hypothetical protein